MKLSSLVRFRKRILEEISITEAEDSISEILHGLDAIKTGAPDAYPELSDYVDQTIDHYRDLKKKLGVPLEQRKLLLSLIDSRIQETTRDYMSRGYMINGFYASNSTDYWTERNERVLPLRDETRREIVSRVSLYSDWRYPGLEIGPGDGVWTPHMVACDPLYIVDTHQEFLDSTMSQFTPEYQRRLRPYHINRFVNSEHDLSMLPQNQIGFVFAWNVFNFFPLENLKNYLFEIFNVMRPGGVCLFSYNNGENPVNVEYVEIGWMSYMPKTLLISMCENLIGFEILHTFDREDNISWIEIKKPGTLKTVKAHQALGTIKKISP